MSLDQPQDNTSSTSKANPTTNASVPQIAERFREYLRESIRQVVIWVKCWTDFKGLVQIR